MPPAEQTKPEEVRVYLDSATITPCTYLALQDYPYLTPIIREIESEKKERMDLDAMVVKRPGT